MNTQLILKGNSVTLLVQGFPLEREDGTRQYGRLRVSTGIRMDPQLWDTEKQRPHQLYSVADKYRTEQRLIDLQRKMNIAYSQAAEEGNLIPARVRELFGDVGGETKKAPAAVVVDMKLVDFIRIMEEKAATHATAKTYRLLRLDVERFDAKIKVGSITDAWADRFFEYFGTRISCFGRPLAHNSMWGHNKNFNAVLNEAIRRKMRVQCNKRKLPKTIPPEREVLDWSMLRQIIEYKPKTQRTVDGKTFLLTMCFTSCRISDVWRCLDSIAERNGILCASFRITKSCGGQHPMVMPPILLPLADQLAAHGTPARVCNSIIRRSMDQLLKEMGLPVITAHDCRRTAITWLCGLGIDHVLTSKLFSGHLIGKQMSVLLGYDKGDLIAKQRLFLRLLSRMEPEDTGGVRLV